LRIIEGYVFYPPTSFEKNFYRHPCTPPLWFAVSVLQLVSEPVRVFIVSNPRMAYQEWGSGPPHFDGKNYQMWSKRMGAFLHGKGQILWDVAVDTCYVQPMDFLAPG
jgi:hypothetical protein